jgi:CheY-like chemotaxis protein
VTTATNGREAIDVLEGKQGDKLVDIILTDILMPEVQLCVSCLRELTQHSRALRLPCRSAGWT